MQGAALLNGLEFDPLTLFEDGLTGPEVDVLRGQIVQALMIPPCVVVDLTWLFWTKRCERIAWKGAGHAEEEVWRRANRDAASSD